MAHHAIVGLGNPGRQYLFTRHNIGFLAIDLVFAELERPDLLKSTFESYGIDSIKAGNWKSEHKSEVCRFSFSVSKPKPETYQWSLIKPQTFMNVSGEAVQSFLQFYKLPKENLLVIHDDIDTPFGQIRFFKNRGHGGQNGVRDISEKLGTQDYVRLKLGVSRPPHPDMSAADWVLSSFSKEDHEPLRQFLLKAAQGILSWSIKGYDKTISDFNRKP